MLYNMCRQFFLILRTQKYCIPIFFEFQQSNFSMKIIEKKNVFHLLVPLFAVGLLTTSLISCQFSSNKQSPHRAKDEETAAIMLAEARRQFSQAHYDDARQTIFAMRDSCRLALTVREAAILLLDSIELYQVRNDTVAVDRQTKEKFYLKKLEHDLKEAKRHD